MLFTCIIVVIGIFIASTSPNIVELVRLNYIHLKFIFVSWSFDSASFNWYFNHKPHLTPFVFVFTIAFFDIHHIPMLFIIQIIIVAHVLLLFSSNLAVITNEIVAILPKYFYYTLK